MSHTDLDIYITRTPGVMGGARVLKGTRIPEQVVLDRLNGGDTVDELHAEYPYVPMVAFIAIERSRKSGR